MNKNNNRLLTVDYNQRIEAITRLIFEIAQGNFDFEIPQSDMEDELDAIIVGIRMLKEELKSSTVSRNYLESIYKGVVDILFVLDENYVIQECNTAAVRFLGMDKSVIIGLPITLFVQDADKHMLNARAAAFTLETTNIEVYFKRQGGNTPAIVSCSQLFDKNDQKSGILVVAKDISMQKQAEDELRKAKEYAETANVAKSSFLANMSHEIRTPLNSILGLAEIMLRENNNPALKKYLELIQQAGHNLNHIINDILDFSKIESGKLMLENVPIDLSEVVGNSVRPYQFLADQKGLAFEYYFDPMIPRSLAGDPTRINQVITNLLSNAIKFTSSGKISVSISLLQSTGSDVLVEGKVVDTGVGIPADKEQLIFESFTQADESVTRKFGGTGLGLSIVRSLLQMMDGDITLSTGGDKNERKGTAFTFSIKLQRVTPKASERTENVIHRQTFEVPVNVLVVDDNKMNLLVAKKMLQNLNASVVTAESAAEAIALIKGKNFEMVIMDIQMPEMDGHQAAGVIRQMGYEGPIVALSANAFPEDVKKSLASGMNDHIQKPFTEKQLFDTISKYLKG